MENNQFKVKCSSCGKEFEIKKTTYYYRIKRCPENPKFYCNDCESVARSEGRREALAKLTPEELEKRHLEASERAKKQWASYDDNRKKEISNIFSNAQKQRRLNMTPEEIEIDKKKMSEASRIGHANMSDEAKEAFKQKCSEHMVKEWANMSDEKRNSIREKQSEGLKRYIDSLPPEELERRNKRLVENYANLPEEIKQEVSRKLSVIASERWENMNNEDREAKMNKIHDGFNNYFNDEEKKAEFSEKIKLMHKNMPEETKKRISIKQSNFANNQWASRNPEDREALIKKIMVKNASGRFTTNSLKLKFHDSFDNSDLTDLYFYTDEVPIYADNFVHPWDHGIYGQNGDLVMLVDLDGSYFHADTCDYDGLHSRLEIDEKRWLTVKEDIPAVIIREGYFERDFSRMNQLLSLTYDEYVDKAFNECRAMPFPEPHYNDMELMKSWVELGKLNCRDKYHQSMSMNTRVGDRLILNFHPSIYHAHIVDGISPADVWKDDKLLRQAISNHTIFQSYLNKNKMLQGFNVSDVGRRVSVFSAGKAKMIIDKYLSEFDTVFDPFSGFSGRMLGTVSLGKTYIGQDVSEIHVRESNDIISFLRDHGINIDATVTQTNIMDSYSEYPCLFTSPPTMDESFVDIPESKLTPDEWIDICLSHFKCQRYVVIVDKTDKYQEYIVDVINVRASVIRKPLYILEIS